MGRERERSGGDSVERVREQVSEERLHYYSPEEERVVGTFSAVLESERGGVLDDSRDIRRT